MGERTMIEVDKDVRRQLRVFKAQRDMTYDEAIVELLEGYDG